MVDSVTIPHSLFFAETDKFDKHLAKRTVTIKDTLSTLFSKIPNASPDVNALQLELSKHLATEKEHVAELQRVTAEKEQLSERLENASYRYMVAEKKLDRAKSAVVAKIEAQMTQGSAPPVKTEEDGAVKVNGASENNTSVEDAYLARDQAVAAAEKRKEQIELLEEQNKKLAAEATSLSIRLSGLTDDDYARTSLFKTLKAQHEELVARVNDLEALNTQLREDAQKLHAERTQYKVQMEEESRKEIMDVESQLARTETDLARIRNVRDELSAEIAIKKAAAEKHTQALHDTKELTSAFEQRISQLEMENERLRLKLGDSKPPPEELQSLETIPADELRAKVASQEKAYALLSSELAVMEAAWKKTQTLASKKVVDITAAEEQLNRLAAEKAKADQKYFAAMKAKEARDGENRALRAHNAKSSEIVSQLKEAEATSRALAINLEKQLAESKTSLDNNVRQQAEMQHKLVESSLVSEGLRAEIAELKKSIRIRDETGAKTASEKRVAEVELEETKVKLTDVRKEIGTWKKKAQDNTSAEEQALRVRTHNLFGLIIVANVFYQQIAYCNVCRHNLKDTVIKTCGHVFCKECIERRTKERSRKCPSCMKAFGVGDSLEIYLTG